MERFQVEFTHISKKDLENIRSYIAKASSDDWTAARFCGRLLDLALSLELAPERGVNLPSRPGIRWVVLKPYLIFYRIIQERKTVLILRFWHGAQHPKKLRLD